MSKSKSAIGTEAPPTGNGGLKAQSSAQRDFSDVTLAPKKPSAMPVPKTEQPVPEIPPLPPGAPGPGDADFDLEYQDWRRLGSDHEEATREARAAALTARAVRPFPDLPLPLAPGQAISAERAASEQPGSTEQPYRNPDAYQGDTWQMDPKLDWTSEARAASIALGPAPALRDARWNRVRAEALEGLTVPNMTEEDDMRAWAAAAREADDDASDRIRAFGWDTFHNRPAKQATIPGSGKPAFEPEPEPEPEPAPKRKRGRPPGAKTKKPGAPVPLARVVFTPGPAPEPDPIAILPPRVTGADQNIEPSYFTANHDVSEDDAPAARPEPVAENAPYDESPPPPIVPFSGNAAACPPAPLPSKFIKDEIVRHRRAAETIARELGGFMPWQRELIMGVAQALTEHADKVSALTDALIQNRRIGS